MPILKAETAVPLALLAAGLAFFVVVSGAGHTHSWYPAKCCSDHDCQKVDSIEKLDDGDLLFRAGAISVVVPAEFMRLPSPDNDTHVCVYRVGSGEYRPRCVFVPGLI